MGFAILGEHRDHFTQNGYVEFEEILSEAEVEAARQAILRSVGEPPHSVQESLRVGRDLWRTEEVLSKIARSRKLAEVAADLVKFKPLRLAYDQLLWLTQSRPWGGVSELQPATLTEVSAFEGICVGAVLCLEKGVVTTPYLPSEPGSGVYLSESLPIDWVEIQENNTGIWWMLVYGRETTLYVLNPQDPHVHLPKRYGYTFGDRLRDDDFPKLVH